MPFLTEVGIHSIDTAHGKVLSTKGMVSRDGYGTLLVWRKNYINVGYLFDTDAIFRLMRIRIPLSCADPDPAQVLW
jgi:hypothetical protein